MIAPLPTGRAEGVGPKTMSLTNVGAVCALLVVVSFVIGVALMVSSGVQVLFPETGQDGLDWIADVDDAGGASSSAPG